MNKDEKLFLAGFKASSEGWNGEYPHEQHSDEYIWKGIKEHYDEYINN